MIPKFNTAVMNYNTDGQIFRDAKTLGYAFVNTGNQVVYINQLQVLPGTCWKTFEPGMRDTSLYRIRFEANPTFGSCAVQYSNLQVVIYSEA
jgi:hypothetical protein